MQRDRYLREGCGFSFLMKQKIKAKNCAVFCFAKENNLFYIYEVITWEKFHKRCRIYYWPRLVVSRSTCPPLSSPPREQLCNRSCSNKTQTTADPNDWNTPAIWVHCRCARKQAACAAPAVRTAFRPHAARDEIVCRPHAVRVRAPAGEYLGVVLELVLSCGYRFWVLGSML